MPRIHWGKVMVLRERLAERGMNRQKPKTMKLYWVGGFKVDTLPACITDLRQLLAGRLNLVQLQ